MKYANVKDQFEVIPKKDLLLKEGFLPPPVYTNILDKSSQRSHRIHPMIEEKENEIDNIDPSSRISSKSQKMKNNINDSIPIYEKSNANANDDGEDEEDDDDIV